MRFRTQLAVALIALAALNAGLATTILFLRGNDLLLAELRSKALTIAASTAAVIDPAAHARVRTRADEAAPEYERIRGVLRRVRDANRRPDVRASYLYTMLSSPDTPGFLRFGIDPEESEELRSHVGDVYRSTDPDAAAPGIEENWTSSRIARDEWGEFLGAMAPIRGADGRAVAAVGVDVDASGIRAILGEYLLWGGAALGTSLFIALVLALGISRRITRPLVRLREAVAAVGRGDLDAGFDVRRHDSREFSELAAAFQGMCKGLRERRALESALSSYVSPDVAKRVIAESHVGTGDVERRPVSVIFSDIRGFTSLTEAMPPERMVSLLNEYFDRMVPVIHGLGGQVDKFIGDGIMAVFSGSGHEASSVRAALAMQAETARLREEWRALGKPDLRIGVGVSTGYAVVGTMGAKERMSYTAIGEVVNIAARIEPLTKDLGAEVLVTGHVFHAVKHLFRMEPKGSIPLKGVSHAVSVYSVLGEAGSSEKAA